MHLKLKSKKVILRRGGAILQRQDLVEIPENKESFVKSNMIIGKLMRPVLQSTLAQQTPSIVVGGDIMDFSKVVKRNARNLQKKKDEENIKFIY